ncbi:MAG TPA: thiamine pyrophosphate-dependent dehydrogenase E1 component subunit alpha [Planctomycetota bacterium]|nr:3-methyl-2-oxobutanoate dehydrogenase [Planctomycetota bacterium]MDP6129619.1 thiamine pyrophosphate-dependent dehydrogenase E1 component subunit alpha [Planctomycetota bacterium]MDP7246180.1 thiamine pyrophosphate-dependent dehydrogenase E1 component subunit alpha [Planctomycetota bacterium]HJM39263.1 thiamine pyrophosphate-dependent dehydrogenase E1 component subunit alpha [Planctomycetota bacterium]
MTEYRTAELFDGELVRVLAEDGHGFFGKPPTQMPSQALCLDIFRSMLLTRAMDDRLLKLQRQGRIGFVGTSTGQEAAIHGSAAAFERSDLMFSALREGSAAIQRGAPLHEYIAHMFGNAEDTAKGRQMPNHFQSKEANFPSWSSVLGTQLPHAVGAAMASKMRGDGQVVCAYSGDGTTSSNGFHSAMNFAGVMKAPIVFIVVDNGWAISMPSSRQTGSSSFGRKAEAYGMPGVDVDGNDALACYVSVKRAVDRARNGEGPSLISLRTYRMLGHSSSDDPTRYRNPDEVEYWSQRDPLDRFEKWLLSESVIEEGGRGRMQHELAALVASAVEHAEAVDSPPLESLVEDVYAEPPRHLRRQVVEALRVLDEKGAAEAVMGKFPL